jgi:hypothetical protein
VWTFSIVMVRFEAIECKKIRPGGWRFGGAIVHGFE